MDQDQLEIIENLKAECLAQDRVISTQNMQIQRLLDEIKFLRNSCKDKDDHVDKVKMCDAKMMTDQFIVNTQEQNILQETRETVNQQYQTIGEKQQKIEELSLQNIKLLTDKN